MHIAQYDFSILPRIIWEWLRHNKYRHKEVLGFSAYSHVNRKSTMARENTGGEFGKR